MTNTDTPKPVNDLSYDEAVSELETILSDLEASSVNVDLLAEKVARGSELLDFCRGRLENVSEKVNETVSKLETDQD